MTDSKPDAADPVALARASAKGKRPARFYREVGTERREDGFVVLLDGRPLKTPGKARVVLSSEAVANAVAAEWSGQGQFIEPVTMPVTRVVNAAIDGVAARAAEVRSDIVAFAASDLLVYRAAFPQTLVSRQQALWDPVIAWAKQDLGASLILAEGVMPVTQHDESLAAVARAVEPFDALPLAALHVVTTLTGSALLALAVARRRLSPSDAWRAAHVDEDWEMEQWGQDQEALERRAKRWSDMEGATLILAEEVASVS